MFTDPSFAKRCPRRRCCGFTIIELVLFMLIIGVGLAGVLTILNLSASKSANPLLAKQSLAVAEGFMDEIMLKRYGNPSGGFSGGATQANRASFDDVSDYNSYNQLGVYSTAGTTAYPGLEKYRVEVSVNSATLSGVSAAFLVNVKVTDPTGQSYVLSGYRTNYD